MAFTAPTYMDSMIPGVDWVTSHLPSWWPGQQQSTPADQGPTQAEQDQALIQALQLPAGWRVVGHSDETDSKTGKATGNTSVELVGPTGQPGSVIVDKTGTNVTGGLQVGTNPMGKDASKVPSPPDKWVSIADPSGNPIAMQDPATGTTIQLKPPPDARVDSPAETASAAAATSNAATNATHIAATDANSAAAQAQTAQHESNQDANAKRLADLQAQNEAANQALAKAKLQYDESNANADRQLKQAQLDAGADQAKQQLALDQYKADLQNAHDKATEAQAQADLAEKHLVDEQTAQYQQGTLKNQTAQVTETSRANQANEANNAATLLERTQADKQAALDRNAATGSQLLQQRAAGAAGINNQVMGLMNNKNYGLGSTADVSGLPAAADAWQTEMMGGQGIMDQAAKAIHDANPALSGTPAGAGYASVMAQIMQKQADLQNPMTAPSATPTPQDNSNTAVQVAQPFTQSDINEGTSRVSPSDPQFLGTLIGHAAGALLSNPTLNNSQLSPNSQFTAPGA